MKKIVEFDLEMTCLTLATFLLIFLPLAWAKANYDCGTPFEDNIAPWLVKVEMVGRNEAGIRNGIFTRCLGVVISSANILVPSSCIKKLNADDLDSYTLEVYKFMDAKGGVFWGFVRFLHMVYSDSIPSAIIRGQFTVLNLKKSLPVSVRPICLINSPNDKVSSLVAIEWRRKIGLFHTSSYLYGTDLIKNDEGNLLDVIEMMNSKKNIAPGIIEARCQGKYHLVGLKLSIESDEYDTFYRPSLYNYFDEKDLGNTFAYSDSCD